LQYRSKSCAARAASPLWLVRWPGNLKALIRVVSRPVAAKSAIITRKRSRCSAGSYVMNSWNGSQAESGDGV